LHPHKIKLLIEELTIDFIVLAETFFLPPLLWLFAPIKCAIKRSLNLSKVRTLQNKRHKL